MKTIKITTIVFLIFILPFISVGQGNVPPPPDNHGESGDQENGSAPIGGGIAMLLTMGAAYGGKKYYDYRKKMKNEMED